jgi:hypothetical protein
MDMATTTNRIDEDSLAAGTLDEKDDLVPNYLEYYD